MGVDIGGVHCDAGRGGERGGKAASRRGTAGGWGVAGGRAGSGRRVLGAGSWGIGLSA